MANRVDNLASHYEAALRKYPGDRFLLVCDIDGTVLDMRQAIRSTLLEFDVRNGTRYFESVSLTDVDGNEESLQNLFERLQIPSAVRLAAGFECAGTALSEETILSAHRRFNGILDLIRWFQSQPDTYVALLTARPERSRVDTRRILSVLEKQYSVQFPDHLIYMKPCEPKQPIWESKVNGIKHFAQAGFHVFAAIDSKSENLRAMRKANPGTEILLLQTEDVEKLLEQQMGGWSRRRAFQPEVLSPEAAPSGPVCFIWDWKDMAEEAFLRFLSSNIQWIKVDAGFFFPDSDQGRFACARGKADLDFFLTLIRKHNKKLNISLPEDGLSLGRIMAVISDYDFEDFNLWFSGGHRRGHRDLKIFKMLARLYPCSIREYSLDSLVLMIEADPTAAKKILKELAHEGIGIFSFDWRTPHRMSILRQLDCWGFHANIRGTDGLGPFLEACLSRPSAITSDFNLHAGEHPELSDRESDDHHLPTSLVA